MRARCLLFAVVVASCLLAPPAWAGERVTELWRSRYGGSAIVPYPRHVAAANPTDGTVWLVEGTNAMPPPPRRQGPPDAAPRCPLRLFS